MKFRFEYSGFSPWTLRFFDSALESRFVKDYHEQCIERYDHPFHFANVVIGFYTIHRYVQSNIVPLLFYPVCMVIWFIPLLLQQMWDCKTLAYWRETEMVSTRVIWTIWNIDSPYFTIGALIVLCTHRVRFIVHVYIQCALLALYTGYHFFQPSWNYPYFILLCAESALASACIYALESNTRSRYVRQQARNTITEINVEEWNVLFSHTNKYPCQYKCRKDRRMAYLDETCVPVVPLSFFPS